MTVLALHFNDAPKVFTVWPFSPPFPRFFISHVIFPAVGTFHGDKLAILISLTNANKRRKKIFGIFLTFN
ncbi:hypothetical protein KBTX_04494 [wastewater metagenome]|uniref:Uncharacterized protein n=2 Tax=unclassified sequences TaxID=12908 RepID=A0A5B8RJB0_9ZZZZ|nr:hypothetical protein KBTEX_04494 [uncultured organism]